MAYVLVPHDILQWKVIKFGYKRNRAICELDTVSLNSLFPASWDSLFSLDFICTFTQITECGFWSLDVILWYFPNIIRVESKGTNQIFSYCLRRFMRLSGFPNSQSCSRLEVPILPAVVQVPRSCGKKEFGLCFDWSVSLENG